MLPVESELADEYEELGDDVESDLPRFHELLGLGAGRPVSAAVDPAAAAVELHELAIALRDAAEYEAAEAACGEAVLLFAALEPADAPDLAHVLVEQAQLLELLDALPQAAACVDRALAILAPLAANAHSDDLGRELIRLTVRAELTSASVWRCSGELSAGEQACQRALDWVEASLSPDDGAATVEALNGLGVVYKFQGRFAEAESVYRRALGLLEAAGQDESDAAAALLHNLGGLAHARGEFESGEPLARRSLELRVQLLGRGHPVTAADRAAWGALLEGLGRLEEAEDAYREALAVFEARLGATSLEVAAVLTSLAGLRQTKGAVGDAERDYRRALEIREAKIGPTHPDTAITLNDLALLLAERQPAEALAMARRALAIFEARLGASHPHTSAAATNVAALEAES